MLHVCLPNELAWNLKSQLHSRAKILDFSNKTSSMDGPGAGWFEDNASDRLRNQGQGPYYMDANLQEAKAHPGLYSAYWLIESLNGYQKAFRNIFKTFRKGCHQSKGMEMHFCPEVAHHRIFSHSNVDFLLSVERWKLRLSSSLIIVSWIVSSLESLSVLGSNDLLNALCSSMLYTLECSIIPYMLLNVTPFP
jgi:hypothetical protein